MEGSDSNTVSLPALKEEQEAEIVLLRTEHISKQFNGIYALKDINFELLPGEIHGLVGENGAGKSTLIKLLTGVYRLDEGAIYWEDQKVSIENPVQSREIGINVIHQDRILISAFNGVENAYLGMDYIVSGGKINWKAMEKNVAEKAASLGIEIDLKKTAAQLSPPQKTCLEIIRAMMKECKLLILDEPTAALTDKEAEILFSIIDTLKKKGTSILYVTHRMDEIFRLTDRITIFKNGSMVESVNTADVTKDDLVKKMTDEWSSQEVEKRRSFGPVTFEAKGITSKDGIVKEGNLVAHSGEILGIFGLGGSGRTELLECVYGYRPMTKGYVELDGKAIKTLTPETSLKNGIVLICEDRRGKAMIGSLSVKNNILLSSIESYARNGILNESREKQDAQEKVDALGIKIAGLSQRAIELSGGNQQKVVFAKALMTKPKVFLCDEPTQAVDVKTRGEIHRLLREKADEGSAVIYVSSDLKEILEVADTIQIMSRGKTGVRLVNEGLTSEQILAYCYDK